MSAMGAHFTQESWNALPASQKASIEADYHIIPVNAESLINVLPSISKDEWREVRQSYNEDAAKDHARRRDVAAARLLCKKQANCKRALALYEHYVFGSDFSIGLKCKDDRCAHEITDEEKSFIRQAKNAWEDFVEHNWAHWNVYELIRRWARDGVQFSKKHRKTWPVELRFIDDEEIDTPVDDRASHVDSEDLEKQVNENGIVVKKSDYSTPVKFTRVRVDSKDLIDAIEADDMFYTKHGSDSTEIRGGTAFTSVIRIIDMLIGLLASEVKHRSAQSSIILVRKTNKRSGPRTINHADPGGATGKGGETSAMPTGTAMMTIGMNQELAFATPKSNFSDASPLFRLMLQQLAVATGWTYSMVSGDSENDNHAGAMVVESPVMQSVLSMRTTFKYVLSPIYRWVIESAIDAGVITGMSSDEVWEHYTPDFSYGSLVSRDELKTAQAANVGVLGGILSPQEGMRRMDVDPSQMLREREDALAQGWAPAAQMPSGEDSANSQQDNASDGSGSNQNSDADTTGDNSDGKDT